MTEERKPSAHVYLTIPPDQPRILGFVKFVEHVGDNSPVFKTPSGVARLGLLLAALANANGSVAKLDRASYELLKRAVEEDGDQAVSLELGNWFEDDKGQRHWVSAGVPTRAWAPYITAVLDVRDEPAIP